MGSLSIPLLVVTMGKTLTMLAALMLAGCAGIGERGSGDPTPRDVVSRGEASGDVHWGGQIVRTENLRDRTRIRAAPGNPGARR